jgi:hypothetical protein
MKYFISILILFMSISGFGQREHHADLTYAYGQNSMSISGNVVKNFKFLKTEKLHLGVGARALYFQGKSLSYLTAPAKHNKSETGIDTVLVQKPMFISVNLSLNASYHFNNQWALGCNVDAIGFTFGKKQTAEYYPSLDAQNESTPRKKLTNESVRPSKNNFLLLGKNNKGVICSEVFVRYTYQERYALKLGYSMLISEYSSLNRIGHNGNYRFRNTSGLIMFGIGYHFI